jgi:subtilisin family serine protease
MATPHVAGAVALLKASTPRLTTTALKNVLLRTADRKTTLTGKIRAGRLNVMRAVRYAQGGRRRAIAAFGSVNRTYTGSCSVVSKRRREASAA